MSKKTGILLVRCVLAVLILLNMLIIFLFSEQTGEESGKVSSEVTQTVAEITVKDFEEKTKSEQKQITDRLHLPLRKIAHMLEFGTLGALVFLLLLTWRHWTLLRYALSLTVTFLYACTDEWHQSITANRGARFTDVLIDTAGAAISCTLILLIALIVIKRKGYFGAPMQVTRYKIQAPASLCGKKLAVASDLHGCQQEEILATLAAEKPDMILIPGDLCDDHALRDFKNTAYDFLRACAEIAPTYYSLGNHELACYHKGNPWRHPIPIPLTDEIRAHIAETGATLLENRCVSHGEMTVCGLSSGINGKKNEPDRASLASFAQQSGFRVLLCHHPEYFVPDIQKTNIDLTVCGHAHGGQWRFFGRGVYAPGQGLFPKYTAGILEGRCVISRGLGNHTLIPRIFNTPELVIVELSK